MEVNARLFAFLGVVQDTIECSHYGKVKVCQEIFCDKILKNFATFIGKQT